MFESLKILVDLIETKSFTRTAAANYVTPSAVSQRIKQLESEFDQPLVIRDRHGVTPTDAGERLYRAGVEILNRLEQARDEISALEGVVAGKVRVGTVTSVGLYELPPYLMIFLKKHPAADVDLQYLDARDIYSLISETAIDLGIVAFPDPNPRFTTTRFRRDRMVLIVAKGHPLAGRRRVRPQHLAGERFVAFKEHNPTARVVERRLRAAGASVNIVHRFANVETVKRAVEVGAGISIVPEQTTDQEVRRGTLRRMTLLDGDWYRPIAVVQRRGRPLSLVAQEFVEVLLGGSVD